MLLQMPTLYLFWKYMPETKGHELEDVARVSAASDLLEDRDLVRPFRLALLGVAIVFVLIGGLLAAYGSGADRPEGVAERWITDVGDTRRDGVKDQARHRVEEVGPLARPEPPSCRRAPPTAAPRSSTSRWARPSSDAQATRVPYRLHQRVHGSSGPAIYGTLVLAKVDGRWHVRSLEPASPTIKVPSEGGPPAAEAPFGLFVGALLVSALVTAFCVALVKAADPKPAVAAA